MIKAGLKQFEQATFKVVVTAISFLLSLTVFAIAAHEAFLRDEDKLDKAVFDYFESITNETIYTFMRSFTFFGKPHFLIPLYVCLVLFFIFTNRKKYALEFGILGATSTALLFGLKAVFGRSRPDLPIFEHLPGYSFPSGHALLTFILCGFLIYWVSNSKLKIFLKWTLSILLVLFSLAQGISRIILKVHYATDVIAGFCLGYSWIFIHFWVQRKLADRRSSKVPDTNNHY